MKNGVNARYKNDVLACRYEWQKRRLSVPISMTKTTSSCIDINEKNGVNADANTLCTYAEITQTRCKKRNEKTQTKATITTTRFAKIRQKNDNHRNDDNEDGDNVYNDNSEDIDNGDVCDKLLRQIRLKRIGIATTVMML